MNDLIWGSGYDNADLMIVADYARKADSNSGKCLSGYYRNKLQEYLVPNQFNVDQTYRTALVKRYVQGLGVGNFSSDKKLLEYHYSEEGASLSEYLNQLIQEIQDIKPRVILVMGEYALRILTGKEGISKWRGSVLSLADDILVRLDFPTAAQIKVVITYHLSIIHNEEHQQYIIRMDIKKACDLVFQDRPIDYHVINIARSSLDIMRFVDEYPIEKFPEMTYDIETHFGFITCAGISYDGYQGLTIPMYGATKYDLTDRMRMQHIMAQELRKRKLVNQNIGYDRRISQRYGLWMGEIIWDTMLAAHAIACEYPKRLDFLTSIYTDMSFYKDEGREFDPRKDSIDKLYAYNCKDAITTFQIYKKQKEELKELGQLEFFNQFYMPMFHMYYDIDSTGILQDRSKRDELLAKYEALKHVKTLEIFAITNTVGIESFNVGSAAQVGKFMEAMGFPVLRHRTPNGGIAINTDYDSLKKMKWMDPVDYRKCKLPYEHAIRFINLILLIRRINKVIEYVNVGVHPDGRIRTSYKIAGTTSGRTSAGQTSDGIPIFEETKGVQLIEFQQLGCSFQTITKHGFIIEGDEDTDIEEGIIGKDVREMYIPDKGFVLIEADGAQAEARVCDVLGEDWSGLKEYETLDKHSKVASMIFTEYSYEDIKRMAKVEKSDQGIFMRQIGKHAKHGKNNGLKAFEFAKKYIPISDPRAAVKLADKILKAIDKAYPNIENVFHKQVEECIRAHRYLVSPRPYGLPCGRLRRFFKKIDQHYINVAYSQLPQSAVSDHTKAAALRINSRIDHTKAFLVAENHDSITALVHWTYIRKYCKITKEELERPIDFRSCSLARDFELVIPAEFSIGRKNWGQMHELKKVRWN